MFGSKNTSLAGIGMILTAIADVISGFSGGGNINWQLVIASIIGGIGLLAAKDKNVTGGTIMQASSTQALVAKAEERKTPEVINALTGAVAPSDKPIAANAKTIGS